MLASFVGLVGAVRHTIGHKKVPIEPRHALVSYISAPSIMVKLERYLYAPKSINLLCGMLYMVPGVWTIHSCQALLCF